MENDEKKKVFLSYNSKDSCIAELIDNSLRIQLGNRVQVARYTRDVNYRESFMSFMNSIGEHDFVIAIVSDNYLKSEACMYEVGEVIKNRMLTQKLLYVILREEDRIRYPSSYKGDIAANIYSKLGRADYILYWQKKYEELNDKVNSITLNEAKVEMLMDLRLLSNIIINDISPFMDYLGDARGISLSEMLDNDFDVILKSIDADYKARNRRRVFELIKNLQTVIDSLSNDEDVNFETATRLYDSLQENIDHNQFVDSLSQIGKLHEMLEKAGIPHKYEDKMALGGKQIVYFGHVGEPDREPGILYGSGFGAICSVISDGYGSNEGLLEISGLMTDEEYEETGDSVLGYLSAENVFNRIKSHYDSEVEPSS